VIRVVIYLAVVIGTELLQTNPSIMVRVNSIHESLGPLLVVLREGCMDLINREKPVLVFVRLILKKILPVFLLRRHQGHLCSHAVGAYVPIAQEADESIVPVVRLGQRLVGRGARLAGPCALHCRPEPESFSSGDSTLAKGTHRLWHRFQFLLPCCAVCAHATMSSVVPKKVVDLSVAEVAQGRSLLRLST